MDATFPPLVAEVLALDFEDGIDFVARSSFMTVDEATKAVQLHDREGELDLERFRIFGRDSAGGLAAFWLRDPDADILQQPIVQLDSTGEDYVVAIDFADFIWLLAGGIGPMEAADDYAHPPLPQVEAIAQRVAPDIQRRGFAIVEHASAMIRDFAS